jgi:hypothetical protein
VHLALRPVPQLLARHDVASVCAINSSLARSTHSVPSRSKSRAYSGIHRCLITPRLGSEAFAAAIERERAIESLHGSRREQTAGYRLRIAFKALYFFLRALQDMLFRVTFFTLERSFPGRGDRGTMKWAVAHPESPVGRHLAQHVPEYGEWFTRWREQRNRIKQGVNFDMFAMDDIGIRFSSMSNEGALTTDISNLNRVGLRDAAQALTIGARLMESVAVCHDS